ncbi:MAG: GNAT family N-acetyltransferase [Bryobacter sp.]|nr:GNAT family N-acetyltransferase [Bryobacter sp.]
MEATGLSYRALLQTEVPALAELLAWAPEAASWADGYPGVVAWLKLEEGERPVGFLLYHLVAGEGEILNLAVAPALRRQGVARELFRQVKGLAAVWHLEVRESNAAARALYRSLGFAEVGRRERYYLDGEAALLLTLGPTLGEAGKESGV